MQIEHQTKEGKRIGPYYDTKMASFLRGQIEAVKGMKLQREIAAEIGYRQANILSMLKQGERKVPLDKVVPLAKALYVDPAFVMHLWFEQYLIGEDEKKLGGKQAVITKLFGNAVSGDELEIVTIFREVTNDSVARLTDAQRAYLREAFARLSARGICGPSALTRTGRCFVSVAARYIAGVEHLCGDADVG